MLDFSRSTETQPLLIVDDDEPFRNRLARAMELNEPALYEDDEQILNHLLSAPGLTFDQLKESGGLPFGLTSHSLGRSQFPHPVR